MPPQEWERAFWPVRAATTASNLINLDAHYTGALNSIFYWSAYEFEFDDDLRGLPTGEQVLGGIPFDVRGVVLLENGRRARDYAPAPGGHPVRVEGIQVGSRLRRLHVLHAAIAGAPVSTVVGSYVLNYADGTRQKLEIVYGRDLRDWWHGGHGDPAAEVTGARVVWTGSNPVTDRYKASLRLFLRSYENPRPEVEVRSIDFVSSLTPAAPFLVAMTVEP